jgi:glyoxylase-like metal-dependent hydrolase (beta-lactamase superfamily II)
MEIFPGVHQIRSSIADRHLFQYVFEGDNVVLLDTGFSSTPTDVILPFLSSIGIGPERLRLAINTHADADHHGGNSNLKQSCRNVLLGCGEMDREVIEDPDRLFASRYNQWLPDHGVGLGTNPEAEIWVRAMTGAPQRIDLSFRGGETIAIRDEVRLRVLHVPGHSHGHLAFYDDTNRAIYTGDALHGNCCPSRDGAPSLPPAYFALLAYLSTIQTVEALDVQWIYSAHWPAYSGPQIGEFLAECRNFADRADQKVRHALESSPHGITLRDCMAQCGSVLGNWPQQNQWLLMYPMHGHLAHLEQLGMARQRRGEDGLIRWVRVSEP